MHLTPNTQLQGGKYTIISTLGQGGFGITYLGEQVGLGRKVAIKEFFIRDYCDRDEDSSNVSLGTKSSRETVERYRQKFIKEAHLIAQLKHSHIISVYDVFEENNTAYYVMEYIDNGAVTEKIGATGMCEADALRYIRHVADALRYIHSKRMNHLDVKPGNILINEEDHAVLIDFGIAKHYDDEGKQTTTTPVGISHGYAPAEQYMSGGVTTFSPATDIYSLGATLYKMLTGVTPPNAEAVREDGLPPMPANISQATRHAVEQAMQPRRKDRPQSVAEFLALLDGKVAFDEGTKPIAPVYASHDENTMAMGSANLSGETTRYDEKISYNENPSIGTPHEKNEEKPQVEYYDDDDEPRRKWLWIILILVVIAVVGYMFVGGKLGVNDDGKDNSAPVASYDVVEECESDSSIAELTENVMDAIESKTPKKEEVVNDRSQQVATHQPLQHSERVTQGYNRENVNINNVVSADTKDVQDPQDMVDIYEEEVVAQPKEKEEEPFEAVEIMPVFPGGDAALLRFMSNNLHYPPIAAENGIQGQVILRFVVKKDGYIGDIQVLRSPDRSLEQEAIRLVRSMPRWEPGSQNGVAVPVWFTLPIMFELK